MSNASDKLLERAFEARREHRLHEAKSCLTQGVELCRKASSPADLALALTRLGQIERDLHEGEAAIRCYEEALALYRAEGEPLKIAHTVRHVGDLHRHEKRHEFAESCYAEALTLYRGNTGTTPLDLANAIRSMAVLQDETGKVDDAKLLWEEARELYKSVGIEAGVAECSRRLARA